jgi:hypothetical protein
MYDVIVAYRYNDEFLRHRLFLRQNINIKEKCKCLEIYVHVSVSLRWMHK